MDIHTERNHYCPECNMVTFQTTAQLNPDSNPHEDGEYFAWVCTVCNEELEISE